MITKKIIKVPIFEFKLRVVVFDDTKEAIEWCPEWFKEGYSALTLEHIDCSKATIIIPSKYYGSTVHELEHVKNLIFKAKGIKPDINNDEVDAYLIGWLYEQVDKIVKRHNNLASYC